MIPGWRSYEVLPVDTDFSISITVEVIPSKGGVRRVIAVAAAFVDQFEEA